MLWILVWAVMVAVLVYFSLVPHLLVTSNETDKLLHIFSYTVAILIPFFSIKSRKRRYMLAFGLFLLGAGNEVFQGIIGGRSASVEDAVANGIGIIIGIFIAYLLQSGWNAAPDERTKNG